MSETLKAHGTSKLALGDQPRRFVKRRMVSLRLDVRRLNIKLEIRPKLLFFRNRRPRFVQFFTNFYVSFDTTTAPVKMTGSTIL